MGGCVCVLYRQFSKYAIKCLSKRNTELTTSFIKYLTRAESTATHPDPDTIIIRCSMPGLQETT